MTSLGEAAQDVLLTADPAAQAPAAREVAAAWAAGALDSACDAAMPDLPARPARPKLVAPARLARRRGSSEAARFALLHAVAHIEFNAIDLAFDLVGRFGAGMPRAFLDDWVRIGGEEALHFTMVAARLAALGGGYGDLPAHDGLWRSAQATANDLVARLAVVPLVLEARGLDVTPAMIARFEAAGDGASAAVLRRILVDEIGHVAAGARWFGHLCKSSESSPETIFQNAVRRHFRGVIKPPFNDSAREQAGLTPAFYMGVASFAP